MTCESFNNIIHELATGRSVEGRLETDARSHAQNCHACSVALDDQQRLTSLLGAVAASDADLEAPDRIEATVLGAFRLAHGTANVVPLRAVGPVATPRRFSHRWMAVAAAIVVGAAATLVSWQAMRSDPITAPAPPEGPIATNPDVDKGSPRPMETPPPSGQKIGESYGGSAPGRVSTKRPLVPVVHNAGAQPAPTSEPQELVTDFYSLVPSSGFAPMEGGQLVRLQVPRASLASLGVPIPVGNPDGSLTADLVMGYDGVAHAIRFVQPNMTDERRIR